MWEAAFLYDWICKMIYSLRLPSGMTISYELVRSRVKNINMRIYPDGRIRVSAASRVSGGQIEDFICSKERFVLKALAWATENRDKGVLQEQEPITESQKKALRIFVNETVDRILPKFYRYSITKPEIGFRDMRSRWGSCCKTKGWVHFSYQLIFQPPEFTEYVIVHELAHLVEPNHSKAFYRVVEEIMPDWKIRKEKQDGGQAPG